MSEELGTHMEPAVPSGAPARPLSHYFVLIAAAVFVYFNALNNQFVYDDIPGIFENPLIASPGNFLLVPSDLINSVCFRLARDNPFPYHAASVAVHAVNTLLVFLLLQLFFSRRASFFGALLFAVHPANSEAVAWISGRGYSIMAMFSLAVYILYYRCVRNDGSPGVNTRYYAAALALFTYFIWKNYSFFVVVPVVMAFSDVIFERWRSMWRYWIPFFAITAVRLAADREFILARLTSASDGVLALSGASGIAGAAWVNPFPRLVYSVFYHLKLLLWPQKLSLYHEPIAFSTGAVWFGLIAFGLFLFYLPVLYRKAKELLLAVGLLVLFLAPTYSPLIFTSLIAERYLYMPSVGLCIAAAFVFERYLLKDESMKRRSLAVFACVVLALGIRTMVRNEDWKTPGIFWRKTLQTAPQNAWAHQHMGYTYQQEGDLNAAAAEYSQALALNPNLIDAYNNLGSIMAMGGRSEEGIILYERLISVNPKFIKAYNNLGTLYSQAGRKQDAIASYQRAIEIEPGYAAAYFNLGGLYRELGDLQQAAAYLNKAVELDPSLYPFLQRLLQQPVPEPVAQLSAPQSPAESRKPSRKSRKKKEEPWP